MRLNAIKKWALIIAGFIGVSLLLGFLLLLGMYYLTRSVQHYSACEVIEFTVAGDTFRVPPNYIWSTRGLMGCKAEGVNLHAAYPDMLPITKEESASPGLGIEITFVIGERGPNSIGARAFAEQQGFWKRAQPEVFHDLWIWTSSVSEDRLYVMPKSEVYDKVNFSCSTDGSVPYPSCRGFYNYSDRISIRFAFSKDYLMDWQLLSDQLAALVDTFKVTDDLIKDEKEENNAVKQ